MQKSEIEAMIRQAFGCTASLDMIPANEYEEWNSDICRCVDEDVKKYLPLLLIRELRETKQNDFQGTGDQLVYFLDGYKLSEKAEAQKTGDMRTYEALARIQEETFSRFDETQAQAILTWLQELALPRYRGLCPEDLDSAIQFWHDKLKGMAR